MFLKLQLYLGRFTMRNKKDKKSKEESNLNEPVSGYQPSSLDKQITFFNSFEEAKELGRKEMAVHSPEERMRNLEIWRKRIYNSSKNEKRETNVQPMPTNYTTPRLLLHDLTLNDAEFISELVNTPEWIKFIGERNIRTQEDAIAYIQKLIYSPNINYWVVKLKGQQIPIGIITFIKREYLDYPDIGFAFLPKYTKQGYAYEASMTVLKDVMNVFVHAHILATTIKENINSIQLLEKLGFHFSKEIQVEDEMLLVYSIKTEH